MPPERERFFAALDRDVERLGRPVAILLTVPWHERSAAELAERYGAQRGGAPAGVIELALGVADETLFWIPEHLALVTGDALFGDGAGGITLCPPTWLDGDDPALLRAALKPVLDLPVERLLVSHGEPVLESGKAALVRALAAD